MRAASGNVKGSWERGQGTRSIDVKEYNTKGYLIREAGSTDAGGLSEVFGIDISEVVSS